MPTQSVLAAVLQVDPAKVMAAPAGATLPLSARPRSGVFVFSSPVNGNPEIHFVGTAASSMALPHPGSSWLTATTRRS